MERRQDKIYTTHVNTHYSIQNRLILELSNHDLDQLPHSLLSCAERQTCLNLRQV